MKCINCGALVGENDKFCSLCGAKVAVEGHYCELCGAEYKKEDKFCGLCGNSLNKSLTSKAQIKEFYSKKILILLLTAAVLITAIVVFVNVPRNKLKYSWGTSMRYIKEQEYTLEFENQRVECDDPGHSVDSFENFEIKKDTVYYGGADTSSLKWIHYSFDEEIGFAQRIIEVKKFYGSKYMVVGNFNEQYYSDIIWIKGNTVVLVSYNGIYYYEKNYFFEEGPNVSDEELEEIKEFFNI